MKLYYLHRYHGIFYYFKHSKKMYGYRLTYYDGHHKRHEMSKRNIASLHDAIALAQTAQNRQSKMKSSHGMTLNDWSKYFLDERIKPNKKISTYKSYHHLLSHDILPYLGQYKLIDITPLKYERQCINILIKHKKMAHKSVMDVNQCLKTVLNSAVNYGLIKNNPLRTYRPPREYVSPGRALMTPKQMKKFNHTLALQPLREKVIFYTLECTGMRIGELLGLRWLNIDTENDIIHIRHTRDNFGLRPPKTQHSVRDLPVGDGLTSLLETYYMYCHKKYHANQNSFVVLSSRGKPITPSLVPAGLRKLLLKCHFDQLVGHFTDHSFRHMLASELLSKGFSVVSVSKYMGHANPDITLKFYAKQLPGKMPNLGGAIEKINHL